MMIKVAILGGSGYTALELIKILLRHPQVEIAAVTSRQEGTPLVAESHPSLTSRLSLRMEPFDPDRLKARGIQCAFGCLPHGVSMESVPALLSRGLRVVDLSADYRLRDPNVYAQWYGESHHDLANLGKAVYGLPEIYGDDINAAQLLVQPLRLRAGAGAVHEHPGADLVLPAVDVLQAGLDQVERRHLALPDGDGGFVDGLHQNRSVFPVWRQVS